MPDDAGKLRSWLPSRRAQALILTGVALGATAALLKFGFPSEPVVTVASAPSSAPPAPRVPPSPAPTALGVEAPSIDPSPPPALPFHDELETEGEVEREKPPSPAPSASAREPARRPSTVQQAAAWSCTTASIDGLSRQIIEQARCIDPNAFVPIPKRPNLVIEPHVYGFLELNARNALVKALDAKKDATMTINSALRTVAQQYLVWRWAANKRCGVPLANRPGESNHQIGLALDIAEPHVWRATLEAHHFKWLGEADRVHFDYTRTTPRRRAMDVRAFQQLWNRNNPKEKIPETGRFDDATEAALKRAPANGFPIGPSCGKR